MISIQGMKLIPHRVSSPAPDAHGLYLVWFPRLTLAKVWKLVRAAPKGQKLRTFVRKMFHWRWNLRIAIWQLLTNPGAWRDHKWEIVHTGLLIGLGNLAWATMLYIESTFPEGTRILDFAEKLARFADTAILTRVIGDPKRIDELVDWAKKQAGQPYNSAGAIASPFDVPVPKNGWFCSELGAKACQLTKGLRMYDRVPNACWQELVWRTMTPSSWTPSELAREGCCDWTEACMVALDDVINNRIA